MYNLFSAVVTFVNCVSVRLATLVQNVFFFGKLFAIGVIICVGFYTLVNGMYNLISEVEIIDILIILLENYFVYILYYINVNPL